MPRFIQRKSRRSRGGALKKIDKRTMLGSEAAGLRCHSNVPAVMAKAFMSVYKATGVGLTEIVNAYSYDAGEPED